MLKDLDLQIRNNLRLDNFISVSWSVTQIIN